MNNIFEQNELENPLEIKEIPTKKEEVSVKIKNRVSYFSNVNDKNYEDNITIETDFSLFKNSKKTILMDEGITKKNEENSIKTISEKKEENESKNKKSLNISKMKMSSPEVFPECNLLIIN